MRAADFLGTDLPERRSSMNSFVVDSVPKPGPINQAVTRSIFFIKTSEAFDAITPMACGSSTQVASGI